MIPDVNVLVAAARRDHPHHETALTHLSEAIRTGKLKLIGVVAAGFLRIVTLPKVFDTPTPADQAVQFIEALVSAVPNIWLADTPAWPQLVTLSQEQNLKGNDWPDAWIAAQVRLHQETLLSFDADFRTLLAADQLVLLRS